LYPEIGFEAEKLTFGMQLASICFLLAPSFLCADDYWTSSDKPRKFFESFAITRGFDPLYAANWYSISTEDISKIVSAVNEKNLQNSLMNFPSNREEARCYIIMQGPLLMRCFRSFLILVSRESIS
jgi:hypothetical protein